MISTRVTQQWHLRYPVISAPMLGVSGGALASSVSSAGALGMIAVGPAQDGHWIKSEVAKIAPGLHFGVGFIEWDVARRPQILEETLSLQPFLVSISFGSVKPYVHRVHEAGALVVTQVNSLEDARSAEECGVDAVVIQGREAGGHTGELSTLTLLQSVVPIMHIPVLAAGGIATPQGICAALMAGAEGVWMGTRFEACHESLLVDRVISRLIESHAEDTVITRLYDQILHAPWPSKYPGRVVSNQFVRRWLSQDITDDAAKELTEGVQAYDPNTIPIYAGESVQFVQDRESAHHVVVQLMQQAEAWWKERSHVISS
ncbi:NAD(P)H-dependent flavin oxidoreductase [Sulfobacillus thermosulfidooxidans]|uniref:NAD(P)H-dependent flavin oxidoreductase n=1 Tax=Sulfobacillus thermosulfidooxidans TaxID=28034 RepID=UPI0003FD498A|nr:nitronate monooxygenase [Sulfobacillus thermosulfidooxidans]